MKENPFLKYKKLSPLAVILLWLPAVLFYEKICGTNLYTFYVDYLFNGNIFDKYLTVGSDLFTGGKSVALWTFYLLCAGFVVRIFTDRESFLCNMLFSVPLVALFLPIMHAPVAKLYSFFKGIDISKPFSNDWNACLHDAFAVYMIVVCIAVYTTPRAPHSKPLLLCLLGLFAMVMFTPSFETVWSQYLVMSVCIATSLDILLSGRGFAVANALLAPLKLDK